MITYDNPASSAAKVNYIQGRGLGGAMWWESSGDRVGEGSLVNMVNNILPLHSMKQADETFYRL